MANVTKGIADRTRSRNPIVQEIVPSSAWTEDSNGHYLLVDLPGFKKDEVKLQLDSYGNITISGERLVKDNKYICFEQTFTVPENSDIDNITGKFDGEILYVTVPRHVVEEKEEPKGENENVNGIVEENGHENANNNSDENVRKDDEKHGDGHEHGHGHGHGHGYDHEYKEKREKNSHVDSFHREFLEKWGKEASQLEMAMKMLKKNKGIVVTAIVAFSLGILVARKFESAGQ